MTSIHRAVALWGEFDEKYFARLRDLEENREREAQAASLIQAAFRSYGVRKRLRRMSRALVRLQTYFRGWVGRLEATAKRIERDAALRRAYFDLCATTIQRHWRGHYSRTNIHDFHARKAYLAAVLRKGHEIREESLRISKGIEQQAREEQMREVAERTAKQMARMHHLVSTHAQPGVLSSPYMAMLGQHATIQGRSAEEILRETTRTSVTLPPLKLRKEVVQPETYKMAPRYVEQGASLRCGDPYQHGREQKQLDAAVASAHMRTLHPAPFRNSLAKPPRVAPVAPLFASMQFDEGSPLVPRSERMTDKARTISKSQWSSATHARALFDTSIV